MATTTMPIQALSVSAGIPPTALKRGTATAGIPSSPIKALSVSAGIPSARRSAFTLVELLVVIGIIAILAAIVTPAVMRAQASARNAAIKSEIDMLHMAIMNYKNQYGRIPPCYVPAYTSADLASKHILRLFPRTTSIANELSGSPALTPCNAIVAWLGGYTTDPTSPLKGAGGRVKLFDFDQSRMAATDNTNNSTLLASRLVYHPSGKPSSPYMYILSGTTASTYGTIGSPSSLPLPTSLYVVKGSSVDSVGLNYSSISAERQVLATGTTFFNPDTFQILCAGRDDTFGTDDDLSNFWPSTRKDYLDSLNQ